MIMVQGAVIMKRLRLGLGMVFCILMVTAGMSMADIAVIVGTVNDDYQVVTDDQQVYEIGFTEQSEKLAEEVNKRVSVKGEIDTDEDNIKTINVVSYEILSAPTTE
jgi:hypothetical protein